MAPNLPAPPRAILKTIERLKVLYEAAGLAYSTVSHFNAQVTTSGRWDRRWWSTVDCAGEGRSQMQVCSCADTEDADFIGAIINAFPEIMRELEQGKQ